MPLTNIVSSSDPAFEAPVIVREASDLIAQLDVADPIIRRRAARDLGNHPEAISVLIAHLPTERDLSVREVMFTTLVKLNNPLAVTGLVALLRSEDVALRNEAVEALKEFPDAMAAIIQELLSDDDPDVRIFCVNILESLCHPHIEEWLLEVLASDSHVNVCAAAVDVLAEVGTQRCRDPLMQVKKRFADIPYLRFVIDVVLHRIDRA